MASSSLGSTAPDPSVGIGNSEKTKLTMNNALSSTIYMNGDMLMLTA